MDISIDSSHKLELTTFTKEYKKLNDSFQYSTPKGLLDLLNQPALFKKSPSLCYWYLFSFYYMRSFCLYCDLDIIEAIPYDETTFQKIIESYSTKKTKFTTQNEKTHLKIWQQLDRYLEEQLEIFPGSSRKYLETNHKGWEEVGKIHFHMADECTKKNDGLPFKFLATINLRIPGKPRNQFKPLGILLKDLKESSKKNIFNQIISPIQKAKEESSFVKDLWQKDQLFTPTQLTADQANLFLKDNLNITQNGIKCNMPKSWQTNPVKSAKLNLTLENDSNEKQSLLGFSSLLRFNFYIQLGDQKISLEEFEKIKSKEEKLIEYHGKWIQLNPKKIDELLSNWQNALATTYKNGISFTEAIRLLSGLNLNQKNHLTGPNELLKIETNSLLESKLADIRTPKNFNVEKNLEDIKFLFLGSLRPYQLAGLQWLYSLTQLQLGGCLADDMGLGKTIQILALLSLRVFKDKISEPNLLIVPASLLGNWQQEIKKFCPTLKYFIYHRSFHSKDKLVELEENFYGIHLIITTYGMVTKESFFKKYSFQIIVLDEAQNIKNPGTNQAKAVKSLIGKVKFALTGTPVENNIWDLWSIFDFTCPGLLGNLPQFKLYCSNLENQDNPKADIYKGLKRLVSPYLIRRTKSDPKVISDLPAKIEMINYCNLTPKQITLYQKEVLLLKKSLESDDGIKRKGAILKALIKFKQICNHPSQYLGDNSYSPSQSGKFAKLKELTEVIADNHEKVLIFSQFKELIDILQHFLTEIFSQPGLILHGSQSPSVRKKVVEQFSAKSGPPFLVVSLKAGGSGLNLIEANHVIHFDRWWNPAVEDQATDRAYRIGQKKNVLVHKFICKGTIEDKIDILIRDKKDLSSKLVQSSSGIGSSLMNLNNKDLLNIMSLNLNSSLEVHQK